MIGVAVFRADAVDRNRAELLGFGVRFARVHELAVGRADFMPDQRVVQRGQGVLAREEPGGEQAKGLDPERDPAKSSRNAEGPPHGR